MVLNSAIYLDHNATSPLLPDLARKIQELTQSHYGNPSSPHRVGQVAKSLLENSRLSIAKCLGVEAAELIVTSGGSEGNNMILRHFANIKTPCHLLLSEIEHPSVLTTVRLLAQNSRITYSLIKVGSNGIIDLNRVEELIQENTKLISVMLVNNEIGSIQPIEKLSQICKSRGILLHSDLVQAVGKMPINLRQLGIDYATLSAHKLGGPKGVGLLYVRQGAEISPLISGGNQERLRRAGTENPALLYGFAEALTWRIAHLQQLDEKFKLLNDLILRNAAKMEGYFYNGDSQFCLPHTLNFGFRGINAESLLIALDLAQIAVSTGSACSSGAIEASGVLMALGLSKKDAKSSIRISLGWSNTEAEIHQFIQVLNQVVPQLLQKAHSRNAHV